jgi:hypothetical protein
LEKSIESSRRSAGIKMKQAILDLSKAHWLE